jgi:hypothetical protein
LKLFLSIYNDLISNESDISLIKIEDEIVEDLIYEIPLNILKEKILYSLPTGTEVDEDCYIVFNKALVIIKFYNFRCA